MRYDLQPETEDGFSLKPDMDGKEGLPLVAWVCFPRISNKPGHASPGHWIKEFKCVGFARPGHWSKLP